MKQEGIRPERRVDLDESLHERVLSGDRAEREPRPESGI
jgi:hypothetical protein